MEENETIKLKIKTDDGILEINSAFDKIEWQMEEPNFTPKSSEWYWALSIFGLAIVVFSILLKNYLFIIIVALAAIILYLSKNKKMEFIDFRLDADGLHIGNKLYNYENFKSFWIFPNEREIAFRYKRHLAPLLIAPFHGADESRIKKVLSEHLEENEEKESLIDLLRKRFF